MLKCKNMHILIKKVKNHLFLECYMHVHFLHVVNVCDFLWFRHSQDQQPNRVHL